MTSMSRLEELTATMQRHVSMVISHDAVSTVSGGPEDRILDGLSDEMTASKSAIVEAADELLMLVRRPAEYLVDMVIKQHNALISLHAIYRFGIANIVPVEQGVPIVTISQKCGLSEVDTARLLRHAMTYYIFCEPIEGIVAHTPISQVLVDDPLLLQWVGSSCEDMWPAATRAVEAMTRWPESQEPNQTGFSIANNTTEAMFIEMSKRPERAQRFSDAMKYIHTQPGLKISHIVDGYDWASLPLDDCSKCTVVDVGGSHGQVSIELSQKYPFLHCVVQDLPEVINHRPKLPADLQERVSFMEHDFFQVQPVKGAEVYFLRWILHDWPDHYAVMILQALIPALQPGSKVILNEICMPPLGAVSLYTERAIRSYDLAMKEVQNARERSSEDWDRLFHTAHPSLKLQSIIHPPKSELAIIVAEWLGDIDKLGKVGRN